jgi:hypothetical protein
MTKEQVGESASRQIGKSANQQISKSAGGQRQFSRYDDRITDRV